MSSPCFTVYSVVPAGSTKLRLLGVQFESAQLEMGSRSSQGEETSRGQWCAQ
ncbi:hypothetical protein M758_10G074000 [Ceratodon purpureus]|nr:hypothetical protein M758_10G074000 [Ceratodon purpureus]